MPSQETPSIFAVSKEKLDSLFDHAQEVATIDYRERKPAVVIELPEELGAALKAQANAHGVSADGYAREVLERELASSL
jgi:predicted DNA binding CopG/RHH family protein